MRSNATLGRLYRRPGILDSVVLSLARGLFLAYALVWLLKGRRVERVEEVVDAFYLDFLRLDRDHVEVVDVGRCEIVTRCRNPCPILSLSLKLGLDTKYVCRIVSEPVCIYVIKRLNPDLEFERNYDWIRPHAESCEERVRLKRCA